ncbi:hypothetical protein HQ529_05340, partial [Candidatus Woesearchaeota archaeon]|nr:hypothetical protein [Candidatus Woesearchaeota archaeon]
GAASTEGFRILYDNDVGDTYLDNIWDGGVDTNPAIRFRTKTAGTAVNVMTITHGGNVGIGTTSPSGLFHVYENSASEKNWYFENAGAGIGQLNIKGGSGAYFTIGASSSAAFTQTTKPYNFQQYYNSTWNSVMYIDNGNVGIGTITPNATLDVNGTAVIRSTLNMTGQKIIGLGTPTVGTDATTKAYVDGQIGGGGYIQSGWNDTGTKVGLITSTDDVNATTLYINNTAGRVGIGTMSPSELLELSGGNLQLDSTSDTGIKGASSDNIITNNPSFGGSTGNWGIKTGGGVTLWIDDNAASPGEEFEVKAGTGQTSLFKIEGSGNVGIGTTTSLSRKLTVYGGIDLYGETVGSSDVGLILYHPQEGGVDATRWAMRADRTNDASYPYLTNREPAGKVVIKTGTAAGGAENTHFTIEGGDGTVNTYFENTNVGIGTTSPTSKLHVVGGANISTNLSVGGTLAVGTYARNWTQFGTGTKSEADTNDSNDVYITGDLEVDGTIHGTIGAENVQDIWVNVTGDTMTGDLLLSNNASLNVTGNISTDGTLAVSGVQQEYSVFGPGTKDEADISTSEDVYITGDLEVDGTIYGSLGNIGDIWVNETGDTMTGNLIMGGNNITNVSYLGVGTNNPAGPLEIVYGSLDRLHFEVGKSGGSAAQVAMIADSGYTTSTPDVLIQDADSDNTRAALQIQGNVGATEVAFFSSGGNVGFGDTTPDEKLDVEGEIQAGTGTYRTTITGGGGGSYIYMGTEASDSSLATVGAYGSLFNIDSSNGPISFKLSGSEKARIDSTGLGVGTTSPGYKLDVRGTGYYSGDLTLAGATKYNNFNYVRSGTAGWFKLGTLTLAQQGNNAWIRMYAGNGYNAANSQNAYVDLFIRTSNGGSVDGNGFCASAFASRFGQDADFISQIKLVSNAAGCSATAYDIYAYTGTYIGNGWYSVETSIGSWSHSATTASDPGVGSSTVYVTPFEHRIGNTLHVTGSSVGIGDSSPDYKFEVDGTSDFGDTTTFGDGAQGTITWGSGPSRFVLTAGSGNELYLGAGGTSGQIVVQTDGDVGIGTVSPDSKFQVNDNSFPQARINNDNVIAANGETGIRFRSRGTSGDAHADIGWTGTGAETGNLVFRVPYTTERMRITSAGNVGIGTASPGQELHIAGSWPQMIVAQDDGTEDASIQFDAGGANNRWNVGPGAGAAEGEEFGFAVYNDAGGHVRTNVWIEETGQVGIGIDDPVGTLTIKAHTNGWDGGITLISQDGLQTFKLHPENSAGYGLMISGETYFANKAAFIGNVGIGIGTASPIAKLEAGYTSYGAGNYPLLIRNGRTYSHVTYDTAVIAQNDVTTLRLVETTGGVNQELGISVGDSEGVITSTEELDFYVSSTPGANIYSGAGGERALRMQTDGDIEMMGGNVGIGTASPSTKLHVVGGDGTATSIKTDGYVEDVSGVVHGNYISSHSWTISTGSVGEFSQNGATSENSREWGIGPQGNRAILWKAVPDAVSGADGGWNAAYFSIDHTKMYRFSVWIKKTGSNDGSTYFGTNGETATVTSLGGTPNSNPYFFAGDLSSLDKWYLLVGYVHGSGDTSTTNYGKIYDGETGKAVTGLTDFKFQTSTTGARHRSYLYYDVTTTDRQYWWDPRVEEVNGKEPTIEALLGMPRSNTNGMYWGSGAAIGIGTTAPSNELEVNGDIELTNLYDNDASNFFDGSCSVSETLNTISSTGAISCQAISLSASSVEDVWINESGDTTGALTSDLNIDANTFVISYDDNRVGIGTASPGGLLDISGDNKKFVVTSNDYELFNFGARGSGGTALDMAYMQMKKEGVITNVLDTNGVSYIMGGNVGIGTTNPDSLLEVEGANAIGHFDSTSALSETRYSRSGTVYGRVAHRSSASSQYATDGFNVISHDELGLVSFDAAGYISFHVGTENPVTEDMRLTVDGELGIGTTVPNSKLDVRGSLNVTQSSGSLIVDSSGNVLIGI